MPGERSGFRPCEADWVSEISAALRFFQARTLFKRQRCRLDDGVLGTRQYVVTIADHSLIQYESLILAQNERWRQA